MRLDSTNPDVKRMQQVSLCLSGSDLDMNWKPSLLFQSQKLAIVPHLLLAPARTVVKPSEHEFVRRPSLLLGRNNSLNRILSGRQHMTGCRTRI